MFKTLSTKLAGAQAMVFFALGVGFILATERMFEGRPMWEMPSITARVCGICPVSHLMSSAKAGDSATTAATGSP